MPLSENIVIRKKFSVLEMIWENRKSNMECIFIYYFTSTFTLFKTSSQPAFEFPSNSFKSIYRLQENIQQNSHLSVLKLLFILNFHITMNPLK